MIELKDIDVSKMRSFGTRLTDVYTKKGNFSRKEVKVWVAFRGEDEFHDVIDAKISDIKKLLKEQQYSWNVVTHDKESWTTNRGKEKTEHIWRFDVVEKGQVSLTEEQIRRLMESNRRKTMFTPDGYKPWYYITHCFFKRTYDEMIVYLDVENVKVVETGCTPFTCPNEEFLQTLAERSLRSV